MDQQKCHFFSEYPKEYPKRNTKKWGKKNYKMTLSLSVPSYPQNLNPKLVFHDILVCEKSGHTSSSASAESCSP